MPTHTLEGILRAASSPSQEFIDFLNDTRTVESHVVGAIIHHLQDLLHDDNSIENIGTLLHMAQPQEKAHIVSALTPHLRVLMCDPVGYQLMGACLLASTNTLREEVEDILKQSLPTLLHHETGVYVVRDLALRQTPIVLNAIMNEIEILLETPLGCELLSWLVDVPIVGSYVVQHWERLATSGPPTALRVIVAALRVEDHLSSIFSSIVPSFVAHCMVPSIRELVLEMVPLLDIPRMQRLCNKLMTFPGRTTSYLIDLLSSEDKWVVGQKLLESSEGVSRVLLVDHLRTFAFHLKGTPHAHEIAVWAAENPNFNEVIVVYDKATSQFYTMDIAYTKDTLNRREWLRLRGRVQHLASVCINYQNDTCRANDKCNMIHIDKGIIRSLRPLSCCAHHVHEASESHGSDVKKILLFNNVEVEVQAKFFASTAGWSKHTKEGNSSQILEEMICRQHQREACGKPETCKFIHVCREVWSQIAKFNENNNNNSPTDESPHHLETIPQNGQRQRRTRQKTLSSKMHLPSQAAFPQQQPTMFLIAAANLQEQQDSDEGIPLFVPSLPFPVFPPFMMLPPPLLLPPHPVLGVPFVFPHPGFQTPFNTEVDTGTPTLIRRKKYIKERAGDEK